jgi:hypothetical protein
VLPTDFQWDQTEFAKLRTEIFNRTYRKHPPSKTTQMHSAASWTWKALKALEPPFPGARVAFVLSSPHTKSGFVSTGWNPIPGQTAADAFRETGLAITKLRSVIFTLAQT